MNITESLRNGKRKRIILDTDTYNEIDDQFALALAMLSQNEIELLAVTAAPFHNSNSESYADGMERQPIRDMYLCGGSANIEILRNAIVKATDMVPHHITKLLKVKDDQSYQALRCGLAIGAALQSIKEA